MAAKDTSVTTIDDAPQATAAPRAKTIAVADAGDNMTGDKLELTIHAGEGELGRQAVFLSINGHGFNIPRGIPCVVPSEVVDILDNAKQIIYEPGENGKMHEREVNRFSYNARPVKAATLAK